MLEREFSATEAKIHFGEILSAVIYGEQVAVITKHGKPVATLTRFETKQKPAKAIKKRKRAKWFNDIMAFKQQLGERQKRLGIKDTTDDVELIRQIRSEQG